MLEGHEPIFGKNIIESLSEGMYDNPLFLFREYIQNSADSIDKAVVTGLLNKNEGQIEVEIDIEQRRITFEDNGTGIPKNSVSKMLANIGSSSKDRKSNKGFRGIGRLGGLGYCKKVRFETSVKGEDTASIFEWDANTLHKILADKEDKVHAGELIKRITNTWSEKCHIEKHFFKVSLIDVSESSKELFNEEQVRQYLSMVSPVPFEYSKFPFIQNIESFIEENGLESLHEYNLNLNGDEVFKGYENPLSLENGKSIDILDVHCQTLLFNDKIIGWFWFGISRFDGVLPKKCWQRGLRLRKSNIQIGEADCLSNSTRSETLWKEDRGNNYYIGEIHVLDENLIPNTRRDYFNPDLSCRNLESSLRDAFIHMHQLYHDASELRSAHATVLRASNAHKEFKNKDKNGLFFDEHERRKAHKELDEHAQKAKIASRKIEKIEKKAKTDGKTLVPLASVVDVYRQESAKVQIPRLKTATDPKQGYVKDEISRNVKSVLEMVFEVLDKMLPENEASAIREAIIKRATRK